MLTAKPVRGWLGGRMHRDWLSDGAESNNTVLDLDGWVLLAMGCGCDIWISWLLRWDGDKLVIALMPVVVRSP